jgi:hypothetical protein
MDMVFGRKIRLERGDVDSLHVAFAAWMERAERALGATRDFRTCSAADRYLRDLRAAKETLWGIQDPQKIERVSVLKSARVGYSTVVSG